MCTVDSICGKIDINQCAVTAKKAIPGIILQAYCGQMDINQRAVTIKKAIPGIILQAYCGQMCVVIKKKHPTGYKNDGFFSQVAERAGTHPLPLSYHG
jgi:hypothetical protein